MFIIYITYKLVYNVYYIYLLNNKLIDLIIITYNLVNKITKFEQLIQNQLDHIDSRICTKKQNYITTALYIVDIIVVAVIKVYFK